MSDVGQIERKAQDRVVKLLPRAARLRVPRQLGVPRGQLERRGRAARRRTCALAATTTTSINAPFDQLGKAASLGGGHDLYEANRDVYDLLRYGVKVKPGVGEQTETVWLIDWDNPEANHFASPRKSRSSGSTPSAPTSCSTSTASRSASSS